jgi:hypothetical protein
MGFLGIIPANKLSALYDTSKRTLILYAEGEVMGATYGFNFKQDTNFFGGLKFTLYAWSGPITGKKQPYTHQQSFNMILPSPVLPSGNVIIVTANHPQGIAIPIYYTGLIHSQADLETASADQAKLAIKNKDMIEPIPNHNNLNVLYKTKFNIKANSSVPEKGGVTIAYDSKYVQLVGSSIQNKDIVWTFLATEMGNTEIYVTISGGIAQFVMQETYDVKIFVL